MVLGIHGLRFLAVANGILGPGRSDTLDAIHSEADRDALLNWLRFRPLASREGEYLMAYAGLVWQCTAAQALELEVAHEVQTMLQESYWLTFLRAMYGSLLERWTPAREASTASAAEFSADGTAH
ncbi:MAG: hypothetical protein EOO81_07255 [Oxalobacteraceae bacterium]|nr:MAG: hypothetical protein EOO81_07255 [Oxalobacteraceae bacterium]